MAHGDEKTLIEAVVTCEGNLHDPDFSERFQILLGNLKSILREDELVKVKKIEPWNSVRVTISIPKEAAQKLKILAQQGSHVLKSLGILTVQVQGDQVISLTLAGQNNEATEVVLKQGDGSSLPSTSSGVGGFLLPLHSSRQTGPSGPNIPLGFSPSSSSSAFRSPNVVAPIGESIPLPPQRGLSASGPQRSPSLGGPFPFASMAHAAQTMQRTDPALQISSTTTNSNPTTSSNVNNHAVNSTNLTSVSSQASASSPVPLSSQPSLSVSAANSNTLINNNSPTLSTLQLNKSEPVNRFILHQQQNSQQLQIVSSSGNPSSSLPLSHVNVNPQSQSLQLQIVNAPPPYPGVNSNSDSNSSDLSGNTTNNFNHHHLQHHQQQQQLISANNTSVLLNSSNNVAMGSHSVTFVGAPSSVVSSAGTVTLVRSVSSPAMSSQPLIISDNSAHGGSQQPMSSPLLVNLLQNNEATTQQAIQGTTNQGVMNIMLPPGTLDQKRFLLQQHLQQRKAKRGLSLDGASLGEIGNTNLTTELARPSSAGFVERPHPTISPAPGDHMVLGSSQLDNSSFSHITLPSGFSPSISSSTGISMNVPISVGQPRPSSDLSTTATIIQGRTIIHQGNVRVFNPGQIRAIRLTQANTSSPSTIHFIQGKPVMTMTTIHGDTIGSPVILNGPHPVASVSTSQNPSISQHVLISNTSTISTSSGPFMSIPNVSSPAQQNIVIKQEPNMDQSHRTFDMSPPMSTKAATSNSNNISTSSSTNSNLNNTFIPPSEMLSATHSRLPSSVVHPVSTAVAPINHQVRPILVQSHDAKLFPSQLHQRGLNPNKPSKETILSSPASHPPMTLTNTTSGKPRQLLINPLTGHLEPMPSESSSESDEDGNEKKKHTDRIRHPKGMGHIRGGTIQHRQIVTTTTTGVTVARVVKSSPAVDPLRQDPHQDSKRLQIAQAQNRLTVVPVTISSSTPSPLGSGSFRKSRDDLLATLTTPKDKDSQLANNSGEKIKLRLKLEKSEPITPAYKVDVSFVKKSEKGSLNSSLATTGASSTSAIGPAQLVGGSPGEQPRVPPLHISLRGKNAAVVVSSPRRDEDNLSPISFLEGKNKSAKRVKNRIKSIAGESESGEGGMGIRHSKNPSKVSRQRTSKDSNVTSIITGVGGTSSVNISSEEISQDNPMKTKLESVPITASYIPTYFTEALASTLPLPVPVSAVPPLASKDLISISAGATTESSTIPNSPSVKLKLDSDDRVPNVPEAVLLPITPQLNSDGSSGIMETSSLLFQHLSKKEGNPIVSVAVTVSQTVSTSTISTSLMPAMDVVNSVSTTSVLTLTSTATRAPLTSVGREITLNDVVSISTLSSTSLPTPILTQPLVDSSPLEVTKEASDVVTTVSHLITNTVSGPTTSCIPKLSRENIPKELNLDLAVTVGCSSEIKKPSTTTPTSKSPKPLPDLLALPQMSPFETKLNPSPGLSPVHKDSGLGILNSGSIISSATTATTPTSISIQTGIQVGQISLSAATSTDKLIPNRPNFTTSAKFSMHQDGKTKTVPNAIPLSLQKLEKSPTCMNSTPLVKPKTSPPTPILRPKVQAPRVSIGTSTDADLPSSTPAPSLRELLEKEKEKISSSIAVKEGRTSVVDLDKIIDSKISEVKENPLEALISVDSNHEEDIKPPETSVIGQSLPELMTSKSIVVSKLEELSEKPEPTLNILPLQENEMKINIEEPLPSTVIPNAPLPFPLILPKADDQTGAPGEDSGIDSMDALSEKSPNQGESPARKEIEQFGDSHNPIVHSVHAVVVSPTRSECSSKNMDMSEDNIPSKSEEEFLNMETDVAETRPDMPLLDEKQSKDQCIDLGTPNSKTLSVVNAELFTKVPSETPKSVDKDAEQSSSKVIPPENNFVIEAPISPSQCETQSMEETNVENSKPKITTAVFPSSDIPVMTTSPGVEAKITNICVSDPENIQIKNYPRQSPSLNTDKVPVNIVSNDIPPPEEEGAMSNSINSSTTVTEVKITEPVVETHLQPDAFREEPKKKFPTSPIGTVLVEPREHVKPVAEKESIVLQEPITSEKSQQLEPIVKEQIVNHLDVIEGINHQPKLTQVSLQAQTPKPPSAPMNLKVRRAKLENIVAAIGTKNIVKQQQAKSEPISNHNPAPDATELDSHIQDQAEVRLTRSNSIEKPASPNTVEEGKTTDMKITNETSPSLAKLNDPCQSQSNAEAARSLLQTKDHQKPEAHKKILLPAAMTSLPVALDILADPVQRIDKSDIKEIPSVSNVKTTTNIPESLEISIAKAETVITTPATKTPVIAVKSRPPVLKPELSSNPVPLKLEITVEKKDDIKNCSKLEQVPQQPQLSKLNFLPPKLTFTPTETLPSTALSISVTPRPYSPQKPALDPQSTSSKINVRTKSKHGVTPLSGRRLQMQDKPPKLSKATETDPRPESANPPTLDVGNLEENLHTNSHSPPAKSVHLQHHHQQEKIPIQNSASTHAQPQILNVSIASNVSQSVNTMQLSKSGYTIQTAINKFPKSSTVTASGQHTVTPTTSITLPASTSVGGSGQTVFAIHQNVNLPANLTHLHSHGQSSITVLPSGQKIVPVKLVTIPRQTNAQFQTIPISGMPHSRASPNILEAVNIVAKAGSRSNSPKTLVTSQIQASGAINLSSMSLSGGNNIHLVPITMASTVGGTSNPVKVIVSQPIKLQQSLNQNQPTTTKLVMPQTPIRVVSESSQQPPKIEKIPKVDVLPSKSVTLEPKLVIPTPITTTASSTINKKESPPVLNKEILPKTEEKVKLNSGTKIDPFPSKIIVKPDPLPSKSVYKHVDGLEILDSGLNQMNDDDLPFEADIIHDEKDLEDVLAGESIEVQENGIDSPYDFSVEEKIVHEKYYNNFSVKKLDKFIKVDGKTGGKDDTTSLPDSPIPVIRASSPLFTYANRSSRTSRTSTRSPSPAESDVHGEDQEIIDSFTCSPSQPKLSPQNKPLPEDDDDDCESPRKPDLIVAEDRKLGEQLSIEIPPVDLMVMSPSHNQSHQNPSDERKSTRSTRSNTRLVSPDITAFRSDTPKPSKFSAKPDPINLRNSPKPSPTGSLKLLSPTVSGFTITPSSSNRSSPILLNQSIPVNHATAVTQSAIEKIATSVVTNSAKAKANNAHINKRKRQESDSSNASKEENTEEKSEIDLNSRPGKRRCSENAAELIKACIGVEDTPKRNSMLIKRMEESKLKEAKLKKAMATLVEENEDDNESVESVLSRGRGRSSRASSEDRSSSRGSSVQRNSGSSRSSAKDKDEDHTTEQKQKTTSKTNSRIKEQHLKKVSEGTNHNSPSTKLKKDLSGKGTGTPGLKRTNRTKLTTKDKSPLTPAKTRTNVRKDISGKATVNDKPHSASNTGGQTTSPPESENLRRKTRSSAAVESSDSDVSSSKRRRISKDAKS